ncbi:hypothetical protein ABC767_12110 [Enterobacter cloacae]
MAAAVFLIFSYYYSLSEDMQYFSRQINACVLSITLVHPFASPGYYQFVSNKQNAVWPG